MDGFYLIVYGTLRNKIQIHFEKYAILKSFQVTVFKNTIFSM